VRLAWLVQRQGRMRTVSACPASVRSLGSIAMARSGRKARTVVIAVAWIAEMIGGTGASSALAVKMAERLTKAIAARAIVATVTKAIDNSVVTEISATVATGLIAGRIAVIGKIAATGQIVAIAIFGIVVISVAIAGIVAIVETGKVTAIGTASVGIVGLAIGRMVGRIAQLLDQTAKAIA
jgi:hypothetical protein